MDRQEPAAFASPRPGTTETAPALVAGATIGHYLLLDTLSKSATAEVHLAHDLALERTVVLKSAPPGMAALADQHRREAQALARVRHPHVVLIYSCLETPDGPALVLEHLTGGTLAQRLKADGRLSVREAVDLFRQLLEALEELHRAQIAHGHIKPDNIFINSDGAAKLIDLRLATFLDQTNGRDARLGDLLYAAPEQINGHRPDARADIYSLGVCLHEAVTGSLPFRDEPRDQDAPPWLRNAIMRATQHDADARYAKVRDFRAALETSKTGRPTKRTDPSEGRRGLRWLRALTVDAALLTTLAALLWMLGLVPGKPHANETMSTTISAPAANPRTPPHPKSHRSPAPPADKYRDLRQAWGG